MIKNSRLLDTHLAADDFYGLEPFLFKDPMVDNALKIGHSVSKVKVHVRPPMTLDQAIYSLLVKVVLGSVST